MRELSHIITHNGGVSERHAVTEQYGGDIVLSSRVIGADVLRPSEFLVPLEVRPWFSITAAIRSAPPLTTDTLADQLRLIASRQPIADAVRLELIAVAVEQMERRVVAQTLPMVVGGDAKVVPISVGRRGL